MATLYWVFERACDELRHLCTQFPIEFECLNATTFVIHHWYHKDMFLRLDIRPHIRNRYLNSQLSYRVVFFQKHRVGACTYSTLETDIPIRLLSIILPDIISEYLVPYSARLKDELLSRYTQQITITKPLSLISFYRLCTNDIFVWNQYVIPDRRK